MRILHVVPSYFPATRYGGPIYSVHGLCKSLANRGHDVHVFTTNVDGASDTDVPLYTSVDFDGVKIWFFPSRYLRRIFWAPAMSHELRKMVSTFDILHLHSIFLWPTWAAARTARMVGVPYAISPRGMLVRDLIHRKSWIVKSLWIHLIEKNNIEKAAVVHCTSNVEATECQAFNFDLPHVTVVPNGIDIPQVTTTIARVRPKISHVIKQQPLVLFLGRINWKKGLDRVIPALSHIPDAYLAIAGNDEDGYTRQVLKMARQSDVANRISILGAVGNLEKTILYKNAKVFVLPSYSENFGNTVLEALAYKCPVVVTPEVGISREIETADAGMIVDGEPKSIADAVNKLLITDDLRTSMVCAGVRLIQEKFRWESVSQQMELVYSNIVTQA